VESNHRIDGKRVNFSSLADYLPMHLALGWNIDYDVVEDVGGAPESITRYEGSAAVILRLGLGRSGQAVIPGIHSRPAANADLAASTDSSPATHRVEVHSEGPGSIENTGAVSEFAATAGGGEDHLVSYVSQGVLF
jgi:hypothetical protein